MDDENRRSDVSKRLGRAMLLDPEQSGLTAQAPDGTRPVVIALPEDLVSVVAKHVHATGRVANVVVPDGSRLLVVQFRVVEGKPEFGPDDVAVHESSTMEMFIQYAKTQVAGRFLIDEGVDALVAEQPHALLAPA